MNTYKYHFNKLTKNGVEASRANIFYDLALLFVKVTSQVVRVYEMTYSGIKRKPLLTLYPRIIKIHYRPPQVKRMVRDFLNKNERFSIGNVEGHDLVTFTNGEKCLFYEGMMITYGGYLVGTIPGRVKKNTDVAINALKKRKNAMNRLYYHRKKATERFEAAAVFEARKNGSKSLIHVDVSQLPLTDVFKLQNVSYRRHLISYYGLNAILAGLESEIIDSDIINGNPYDLVSVTFPYSNIGEVEKGTYLRMVNPSTDEIHFEGVPNYDRSLLRRRNRWDHRETISSPTVRAALAWRDRERVYSVPKKLT